MYWKLNDAVLYDFQICWLQHFLFHCTHRFESHVHGTNRGRYFWLQPVLRRYFIVLLVCCMRSWILLERRVFVLQPSPFHPLSASASVHDPVVYDARSAHEFVTVINCVIQVGRCSHCSFDCWKTTESLWYWRKATSAVGKRFVKMFVVFCVRFSGSLAFTTLSRWRAVLQSYLLNSNWLRHW